MGPRTIARFLLIVAGLCSLCPGAASAERYWSIPGIKPRSVSLEVLGGYHAFFQEEENFVNNGVVGGRVGFNFNEFVALEAVVRYVPTVTHQTQRKAHVLLPTADLVVHFGKWPAVPYLSAGVGLRYFQIKRQSEGQATDDQLNLQPKNPDSDFTWDAGGGVKILFISRFGMRIDARYFMVMGPSTEAEAVLMDGTLRDRWDNLEITGSLFGLLGGPPDDPDADGIPSKSDDCPDVPEDFDDFEDWDGCPEEDNDGDGFLDWEDDCPNLAEDFDHYHDDDGCPEEDNDRDGIPDRYDKCPETPEDFDDWEDEDGCPDGDNDGDGFPDEEDECPMHAEDEDGFQDADGCPEKDNDNDGLVDKDDLCPNDPENANGYQDDDGCPDEVPVNLTKIVGVIRGINFKVDSDELKPSSFTVLNEAAAILREHEDICLEIQGHASAEGDDDYNMDLSQRRAESVMRYLVNQGISEKRLVAIGYGETRPIAEDTQDGRVLNRRVEFHLITGTK